jgi:hypothetical protein
MQVGLRFMDALNESSSQAAAARHKSSRPVEFPGGSHTRTCSSAARYFCFAITLSLNLSYVACGTIFLVTSSSFRL